jgi:hypothetical protein
MQGRAFTPDQRAKVDVAYADLTVLTAECERRYTLFKASATLLNCGDVSDMESLNRYFSTEEVRDQFIVVNQKFPRLTLCVFLCSSSSRLESLLNMTLCS